MKTNQIIIKVTEEQKDFLLKQAKQQDRTITAIVNIALGSSYPEYKEITKGKGE